MSNSRVATSPGRNARNAPRILAIGALLCGLCAGSLAQQAPPAASNAPAQWPKQIDGYQVYQLGKDEAGEINCKKLVEVLLVKPKRITMESLTVGLVLRVHPISVSGEIQAVRFDKMKLNDVPFDLAEYRTPFDIPRKGLRLLPKDLDLSVKFADLPAPLLRNLVEPDKDLRIEGTLIIFGTFRKFLIPFKRAVPVELKTSRPNPFASLPSLKAVLQALDHRP